MDPSRGRALDRVDGRLWLNLCRGTLLLCPTPWPEGRGRSLSQPWLGSVPGTLAATESRAQVFLADAKWKLPFAVVRAWQHASRYGRPTWVPAGGANPLGVLGGVNAALEFWDQVNRGEAARPDVIVAPLGSGATVAGLLLGSWIAESDVTICGVRVADPIVANRWQVARLVFGTGGY